MNGRRTMAVLVAGQVNGLSPEEWERLRPRMEVRSVRPVEYQGETVPAGTLAVVLEPPDAEGFLAVEWRDRPGLYAVHARDVVETGATPELH